MTLLAVAACSSDPAQPDGARADAPVPDAPSIVDATPDATPDAIPDAAPDARVDGPGPMGCVATTELVADIAPHRFRDVVTDGTHIVTAEYMTDGTGQPIDGRVVSRDLLASAGTTLHTTASGVSISTQAEWVYILDYGTTSILRWREGESPTQLITGVSNPQFVAANTTHIYWSSTNDTVDRRLIGGGPIEPVAMMVDTFSLFVNDTDVYVGDMSPAVMWRYPTNGDSPTIAWDPTGSGFAIGIAQVGGILYWADFFRSVWRRDLATETNTLIASSAAALARPVGVAIRNNYIYVVDQFGADGSGIYRAPKSASGGTLVKVSPDGIGADVGPVVLGTYLHWGEYDKLWRCNLQL